VLRKRASYRQAFDGFDPHRVARYGTTKVQRLLENPGIVRNRLKVASAITNARAFLEVQASAGSFDAYLWQFTDGRPVRNRWKTAAQVPASTPLSDRLSKDLAARGFRFVGSTICYAYAQAVGLVNDHLVSCFRHAEVSGLE
jgi:DNA-3-methyladenine glycosylase I